MTSRTEIIGQNGNTGEHYDDPWFQGDQAAKKGLGRDTNPYKETDQDKSQLWEMGYFGLTDEDMKDDERY